MEVLLQVWGCGVALHSPAWCPHLSKGRALQCVTADSQRKRRREEAVSVHSSTCHASNEWDLILCRDLLSPVLILAFPPKKALVQESGWQQVHWYKGLFLGMLFRTIQFQCCLYCLFKVSLGHLGTCFFHIEERNSLFVKSCLFLESRCYEDNTNTAPEFVICDFRSCRALK